MVSLHASQPDDPSLNPAEVNFPGFFVYTILKLKNRIRLPRVGQCLETLLFTKIDIYNYKT